MSSIMGDRLKLHTCLLAVAAVALASSTAARAEDRTAMNAPMAGIAPVGPHEEAAPTIESLVAKHAHDNGIPVGLAKAVIGVESRGNPKATNHGAMGLMQIKAATARTYGFSGGASGLLTPDTNLRFGMRLLAAAYRAEGGDVCRTLAFYQSGHRVHRFSAAQRHYCSKARAIMAHA